MPVSLLNADTSFPSFTEGTSTSEKVDIMMNYLYMLLEELRYTFGNLGTENFNDNSLNELSVQLTKPVYGMIEDETAGLKHEIKVTAEGLESLAASVTEDAEALAQFKTQVSDTYATISSFASFKNEMNTAYTSFTQTADSKYATVSALASFKNEMNIAYTSFTQTADSKYATVSALASFKNDINSSFSSFTATAESTYAKATQIASVTNSSGKVTAASIVTAVNNSGSSVKISADKVDISGFVTFSDLSRAGYSTINGSNITTGKIQAITISGSNFRSILNGSSVSGEISFWAGSDSYAENKVGYLRFDNQGVDSDTDTKYRIILDAQYYPGGSQYVSLKLKSGYRMSLESSQLLFMNSGTSVVIRANNGRGMINLDGDVYIRGTSLDEILASL